MSERHLQTELDDLRRKVIDIEGPIKESIGKIKNSLLGSEDGSSKGLLSRVLILEIQVSELMTTAADLQRQLDTDTQRIVDIKSNCVKHTALIDNLRATTDEQKSERKWLHHLFWGTVITGLLALIGNWILHILGWVK